MKKPKIPENRGKKRLKYDFKNMEKYQTVAVKNRIDANRWSAAAHRRGFRIKQYTQDNGQLYIMFMGKKK